MSTRALLATAVAIVAAVLLLFIGLSMHRGDTSGKQRDDLAERLEKLRSLPYTSVTSDDADQDRTGVTIYDGQRAYPGYNLFCSEVSPTAFLMDMEGNVVHRWEYSTGRTRRWTWAHAIMLDNGDLVVVDRPRNLMRLGWNSNLLWLREMEVHHDIAELPDGSLLVTDRETWQHRGVLVRFAAIVRVSADGDEIERWSTYDHLDEIKQAFDQRSFLDAILDSLIAAGVPPVVGDEDPGRVELYKSKDGEILYDYFHMNTISLIPNNALAAGDPRFATGNLLICFRNVNQIAILDKDTKEILWVWGEGVLEWPHHPTMLENGNILLFDNGIRRGYSKILEIDPVTGNIEWQYVGDPPESFYSAYKGSAQRLPNGNTLICDSEAGRAFEITQSGEIVWDWWNPNTLRVKRVQVYRMTRLPADKVERLLRGA
jgi:hypothetical protein